MANYEYKLTRSAGELGLRQARILEIPDSNGVIAQEFVGVAADDNNDVYRTSFVNGKTLLTDVYASLTETWKVTRINHPELGWISYADSNNKLFVNFNHVVYQEPIFGVSYGAGGVINGTLTAFRYTMLDGSTIVVTQVVVPV